MYPRLFDIPIPGTHLSLPINTYGLFIAIGFLAAVYFARKEAERIGENSEHVMDLAFYLLLAAIVFSRLFYVVTFPGVFIKDPLEVFRIWNGGLVFYGGFIGALITAIVYIKIHDMPLWRTGDIIAPGLAVGHFFGRLGCFSAGCCYGKTCELPWAVRFTHPLSLVPDALKGVPLHPTQLYSALNNLIIFLILLSIRKIKPFNGFVFWMYVLLYGVTRSLIELLRSDHRGGRLLGVLTVSQTIGLTMSVIAAMMLIVLYKRSRAGSPDRS